MKSIGIDFPSPAQQAVQNAREYAGLSASERFDILLSLLRVSEELASRHPDPAQVRRVRERMKTDELNRLVRTQVKEHV